MYFFQEEDNIHRRIGDFFGGYFLFSTEERKNTSEVSFDSSDISFHSSEVSFDSSEEIELFLGAIQELLRRSRELEVRGHWFQQATQLAGLSINLSKSVLLFSFVKRR